MRPCPGSLTQLNASVLLNVIAQVPLPGLSDFLNN